MNDWNSKLTLAAIPVILTIGGWVLSLETRLQQVSITQQERTTVLAEIKQSIRDLSRKLDEVVTDPNPRPAAKIMLDEHSRRLDRLDSRMNYMHEYIISLPVRPPPMPYRDKRGDLVSPILPQ